MSVLLLATFAVAPVVLAEKARFFSSKGGSAFKSRTREVKTETGRSLLSTAKSASGVGSALYPSASTKLDRQSSRKLLEMFDRKRNWVFHGLGNSDDEKEDASMEDDWTSGEKQLFRDSYRRPSGGVVEDFIRGDDNQTPNKNGRTRNTRNGRQNDPTQLEPEEDDEDRLMRDETKLELELTKRRENSGLAFTGNSPFAARTALSDASPFARRKTGSNSPFKFKRGNGESRVNRYSGSFGARPSGGQAGGNGKGGFFTSSSTPQQSVFGGASPFAPKGGGSSGKPLGLAPLNFGSSLNPGASTPVTGVGVDELKNAAKPPALGIKPPGQGNAISSIISAPAGVTTKRSMPLLFQGNRQGSPTVRGGLLNNNINSPFGKKPGGR